MTPVILFVLGIIVGSFLNVVGLRWEQLAPGQILKTFGGRSKCPYCTESLRWWELIPVASFLFLRAKCARCGAKISWQYPLVELWTGLVFVTVPLMLVPVFCIYIVITIYDFKHKIIPDELVFTSIFLSFLAPLFFVHYSLLDWLAGPILFCFFGLIWLLSAGRAMGFGDAKLGLSVGLLLGAHQGFSAIVLAFWLGAIGSVAYIFLNKISFLKDNKELTMKSEVPFAPFIILGAWISIMFNLDILYVSLF